MSNSYDLFIQKERNRRIEKLRNEIEENEILKLKEFFQDNYREEEEKEEEEDDDNENNTFIYDNNPTLPIYLQIKIIRLFSEYVNRKMKNMEFGLVYKITNQNCSRLKQRISLVNWLWFNTFSKHLSIKTLVYNQTTKFFEAPLLIPKISNIYSLYKDENIKTLILTGEYTNKYQKYINLSIPNYSNSLKKIILPNLSSNHINDIINNQLKIKFDFYLAISHDDDVKRLLDISKNSNFKTSHLSLNINRPCNQTELIKIIETINPTKLSIQPTIDWKFQIEKIYNNISNNETKSKLKEFHFNDIITVCQLKEFLENIKENSSSLRSLSIELCFDTLIYRMTNGTNDLYQICECCQISNRDSKDGTTQAKSFVQFNEDWFTICKLLKNNFTKLNNLSITNSCRPKLGHEEPNHQNRIHYRSNLECGGRYCEDNKPFPIEFIDNMTLLINSCINLKKFNSNGFHTTHLFENLATTNNTIEEYESSFSLINNYKTNLKEYKDKIKSIISNQHQIKRFKIINISNPNFDEFDF